MPPVARAGMQEGSCAYPHTAQCSPQGLHSHAGREPQGSSPRQPSVGSQAALCLSEPVDHRHHGTEDYSGSFLLLSLQPQLGQRPHPPAHHPGSAGDGCHAQK